MAKRAAEYIAELIGMDLADMKDYRYHYGHTSCPVYAIGNDYFCCPSTGQKPPKGWEWKPQDVSSRDGRIVYKATAASE